MCKEIAAAGKGIYVRCDNTNTAMKAYDELSRMNIIYNKRGLGYFVTPGACENIRSQRREEFFNNTITKMIKEMEKLDF